MVRIPEIFKVRADNFSETMTGGSGTVSFKVPEYQRPYNWDQDNVQRLLVDCLNGLKETATQQSAGHYTFLGTIILTSDDRRESTFEGDSLLLVDGQQRLTTLLLLACALFVAIDRHKDDINKVKDVNTKKWLTNEVDEQRTRLYECTTGKRNSLKETTPFPRMIRTDEDVRGHYSGQSEYRSTIAKFLKQFEGYCLNSNNCCQAPFPPPGKSDTDTHLLKIYSYIEEKIEQFIYQGEVEHQDDEFAPPVVQMNEFQHRGCRALYVKLKDVGEASDSDRVVTHIATSCEAEGLVRLILFSSYLIQSVVLALVEAPDEDIAFDIFDALNTTGEPLTALETLKPHVVRFERDMSERCPNAESEELWKILEESITEPDEKPDQRQKETKELVIGFALYYIGEKIGTDLKVQRNALRRYFRMAQRHEDSVAKQFVRSLGDMAQFRRQFWDKEAIDAVVGSPSRRTDYDMLKLCLRFITDTKSSLTIPILARYWVAMGDIEDTGLENGFLRAVQAVTAFLVLRRAMTGGTARIDSDFRNIMSGRPHGCAPLCMGESLSNCILTIGELKSRLRSLLADHPFNIDGKEAWLQRAHDTPLANKSAPICKFLLFAAAHNARPDKNASGMLRTQDIIPSDELNFLSYRTWIEKKYATLEHVAPASDRSHGWDLRIYEREDIRHTIGNLVLLPEKENKSIGKAPWSKKRAFYQALTAQTAQKRKEAMDLAEAQGLQFSQRTRALIKDQNRLHMLDALADVDDWTAEFIKQRTINILSLAWDQITPWLYE